VSGLHSRFSVWIRHSCSSVCIPFHLTVSP